MHSKNVQDDNGLSSQELEAAGRGGTPLAYLMLIVLLTLGIVVTVVLMAEEYSRGRVFIFMANSALLLFALILHPLMRYALIVLFGWRLAYIPYMVWRDPGDVADPAIAIGLGLVVVYHGAVLVLLNRKSVVRHFRRLSSSTSEGS